MSSMDTLDVGQANEFKLACRRNDFTPEDLKHLCEGDTLSQVRRVLLGHASIVMPEHLIDLDADPFVPDGWKVEEHQKGGAFKWNPAEVKLHLDSGQKNGKRIEGDKLRKRLKGMPVLNANVLDYLLKNPQLIPEDWKKDEKGNIHYIFFWGTIYRYSVGRLCARCLCWSDGGWRWDARRLDLDWYGDDPAAVRASPPAHAA